MNIFRPFKTQKQATELKIMIKAKKNKRKEVRNFIP